MANGGGVMHLQDKCERRKRFAYWEGDKREWNGHRKRFQIGRITLKNMWLLPRFMLRNGRGKPIQRVISF